jgi:class 3 adenylate cyclase
MHPKNFVFGRSRGIVWVADLVGSSHHLNSKESVDSFEEFLPRLHWMSSLIVEAAGGKFIKWTGDGFLAWFETPLHREIGQSAAVVFDAVWQLTVLVNVTQLGVKSPRKFKIRHGVTLEQDALTTRIVYPGGFELLDLTGRAVVLAFRLSGIPVEFPGLVTEKTLVDATKDFKRSGIEFARWNPPREEKLKFFKGEKWGTNTIYASCAKKPVRRNTKAMVSMIKKAIAEAEGPGADADLKNTFPYRLSAALTNGPPWCKGVGQEYARYINDGLLGSLKMTLPFMEEMLKAEREGNGKH